MSWPLVSNFKKNLAIKKTWYTHTMYLLSHKKRNKIMPFTAAWMAPEIVIQSEVSQKETYQIIPLICGT